ncbi:flagellar biosynthesis protein FlgI [Sulfitobacter sp. JBTF-M27]|uniref:Flagellar biosynthesis protein FlgI n=1 Tax=Sulfitobacter sediminilitoris TaxID=2698830 RepID=A0A6P0CF28_9RHOB|nr:flagellar biosynthesis protein FlgI [Sulfitobacter sediminilitoris]NEK23828.1 flagellar biosynthesis protein FlgI [Sulfitobacter sediminilitoris]
MIPRKKFRFGERDASKPSAQIQLTAEDEQNLDAYVIKIKETVTILRKEMNAIKEGELEAVSNLFDEKSRVLKWLELRTPLVEPFLNHEFAQKLNIKGHLIELRKYIEEDGAMLSRMAVAARTVLREIEKINNRNTLGGVYGKSGEKIGNASGGRINVDEEL